MHSQRGYFCEMVPFQGCETTSSGPLLISLLSLPIASPEQHLLYLQQLVQLDMPWRFK